MGGNFGKRLIDPLGLFTKDSSSSPTPPTSDANTPVVPGITPPVTMSDSSVTGAQEDFTRQNMLKKSYEKTIYAGDTGGYKPNPPPSSNPQTGSKYF